MARAAKTSGFSRSTMASFNAAAKSIVAAAREAGAAMGPHLRMFGEEIMADVKRSKPGHGVPVDKGTLRGSGRVEGPSGTVTSPRVAISFGSAAAPYAMIQHEVLKFRHTVGEARYLVRGLERWMPGLSRAYGRLKQNMQRILSRVR